MKKIKPEDIQDVVLKWTKKTLLMDVGYYAGRPPSNEDLSSQMLEMIYQGIRIDLGEMEAENFVLFVEKLHDLSPSVFVGAFQRFLIGGCQVTDGLATKADRARITHDSITLPLFARALFGQHETEEEIREASQTIKHNFLVRHQK